MFSELQRSRGKLCKELTFFEFLSVHSPAYLPKRASLQKVKVPTWVLVHTGQSAIQRQICMSHNIQFCQVQLSHDYELWNGHTPASYVR
jgi:hypothetical protein